MLEHIGAAILRLQLLNRGELAIPLLDVLQAKKKSVTESQINSKDTFINGIDVTE